MKINNPCIYVGNQALVTKTYFVEQTNVISSEVKEVKQIVLGDESNIPSGIPPKGLFGKINTLSANFDNAIINLNELSGKVDSLINTPVTSGTQLDANLVEALNRIIPSSITQGEFAIYDESGNPVHFVTKKEFTELSESFQELKTNLSEALPELLSTYITSEALDEKLTNYVVSDALNDYVKKGEINLNDFINESTLSGYATKDYVSEALTINAVSFDWPILNETLTPAETITLSYNDKLYTTGQYTWYTGSDIPSKYTEIYGKNIKNIFDCTISGIKGKIISCYMPHNEKLTLTIPDVLWDKEQNTSSIHIITDNKSDLSGWIAFIGNTISDTNVESHSN
jgi:hypothetical protein